MPFNFKKKYNDLLDITGMNERQRTVSLRGVFDRDITNHPNFAFRTQKINPTPADGVDSMDRLFTHLTTKIINSERKREYDQARSVRLHWLRFHIEEHKTDNMFVFSVQEPEGTKIFYPDFCAVFN